MPLGNLTSQFFANVYLNELDYYIKHVLKVKYYIRYVDDFVILHNSKQHLEDCKERIDKFLKSELELNLHPDKSKIISMRKGVGFLGFRIFNRHILLKKSNLRAMKRKYYIFTRQYHKHTIEYDKIYDFLEGWFAYAKNANIYKYRMNLSKLISVDFPNEISTKEYGRMNKIIT